MSNLVFNDIENFWNWKRNTNKKFCEGKYKYNDFRVSATAVHQQDTSIIIDYCTLENKKQIEKSNNEYLNKFVYLDFIMD